MCEFCVKHGDGEKWYLNAANYSEDLLSDIRRRRLMEEFLSDTDGLARANKYLEILGKTPRPVKNIVGRIVTRKMKKNHFGQVVPIEDIEKVFGFVNSIVRISCVCRHVTLGKDQRYCYAVSLGPGGGKLAEIMRGIDESFINGPDAAGNELLAKNDAIAALRGHEQEGLCHSIWTFKTPFIAAICNCGRTECLAMRTVAHGIPFMFRAEYVAEASPDTCTGCLACLSVCQFGAIRYNAVTGSAFINQRSCYGCGVCRSVCNAGAIDLKERNTIPAVANLW
ncbi:MAG: 4Fe-4S dicluster domain-containing protein [Syntrophorhabdaceae bacterium]|nr:4Fe-4S dicluster domain-containing protein [Syntrophorhabdaceae bacterium]MDD4196859.1 4Fe-4S dicluster domain-containing protein [Syntrophorhabdaceae bacterium]